MSADSARDDFDEKTKRILAERVAYLCSNPDCMRTTIGPHSDSEKSLKTGRACHICAAAPSGPRYDKNQTPDQRKSIENGIWMCSICSDKIDKDFAPYPKEKLFEWKTHVEAFVSGEGAKPPLPEIAIETLDGIRFAFAGSTRVTGEEQRLYRDHTLIVINRHTRAMLQFQSRLQYPEGICDSELSQAPAGVQVYFRPEQSQFIAHISGSGSIEQIGKPRPAVNFDLGVSELLPGNSIEIHFRTIEDSAYLDLQSMFNVVDIEMPTRIYLEGSYQSEWQGRYLRREFLVPLTYDSEKRIVISEPAEPLGERSRMHTIASL